MTQRYSNQVFRRGLGGYLAGRVVNAVLGFSILIHISRRLSVDEYGKYVAAYAMLEIGILLCGLGLEWVTAIHLPPTRQKADGRTVNRFVLQCIAAQGVPLLLGAAALFGAAPLLAGWLGLEGAADVVRAYAIVMWVEGLSRVFRDQILSCLMMQSAAQSSQLVRNLAMLAFVAFALEREGWRGAEALALGELLASSLSLLVGAGCLFRELYRSRHDAAAEPDWQPPRWRSMLATGRNAWIANLANLSWGPQAVILLASRVFGAGATAELGFARNLTEQVRKYMPMEFLLSIVRTLLVVRYTAEGSAAKLGARVSMLYKANLLFLLPLLVLVVARGDELCVLLSAGHYGGAHWLLAGWLGALVILAHRRLSDVMAHIFGRSIVTMRASVLLLVTPAAVYLALRSGQWLWLFLVLALAEFCYSTLVVRSLRTADWAYQPHWPGLARFGLAAALAALLVWQLPVPGNALGMLACAALACVALWGGLYLLRPWSEAELALLPQRVGKWAQRPVASR